MGQKVNPHGLRVGVIKDWDSRWCAESYNENMNSEDQRQMAKDRNSHKPTAKAKMTIYSFDYSAVKQFIRAVRQHVAKRLILPRQNC